MLSRQRLALWLLPVGLATAVAAAVNLPALLPAGADPVPVLPQMTPAQVMELVQTSKVTSGSGDVTMTARLGLPDLSSFGGPSASSGSVLGLLTGTHTAHVWVGDGEHVRVALDAPGAETDWIRNGNDLWAWDSAAQQVRHATAPAHDASDGKADHTATTPPLDPATAADRVLAMVDPTTDVSVRTPGYVAGRPVYELVVKPKSTQSTVGSVQISVDATTGLPLALQVMAKGATDPAYEIAYTRISFDQPAASTFAFTPPPGVAVTEVTSPADLLPINGWAPPRHHRNGTAPDGTAPDSTAPGTTTAPASPAPSAGDQRGATTVGQAWDTVAVVRGVRLGGTLGNLLNDAPTVTLADGTQARVITTKLVNLLVTSDGRLLIGAVDVDTLKAAAAS